MLTSRPITTGLYNQTKTARNSSSDRASVLTSKSLFQETSEKFDDRHALQACILKKICENMNLNSICHFPGIIISKNSSNPMKISSYPSPSAF